MAQIRIQPKPATQTPRAALASSLPIAILLTAGLATTLWLENGRQPATEAVTTVAPAAEGAWAWVQRTWLGARPLEANGRAWVLADHPAVTWFDELEMTRVGEAGGWTLFANRVRGLPALSDRAGPYDRLYVQTAPNTFAPLRWRDIPPGR
jgi:hypothetical protein